MKTPKNVTINPRIRTSDLPHIKRSPMHFLANRMKPEDQTEAQVLGNALHTAILEPVLFDERFFYLDTTKRPVPEKDFRTKANNVWKREQYELNKDKLPVSDADMEFINGVKQNIALDPLIPDLMGNILFEHNIEWEDPDTGLPLGSRLDGLTPPEASKTIIVEVKSTTDASDMGIIRDIKKHFYHGKAHFQTMAVEEGLGRKVDYYIFIFCEKKYPYAINKKLLSHETFETVSNEVSILLHDIKKCFETGEFPGYEKDSINELGLDEIHIY